ncbi:MAG TPA: methyltransferase [Rhizomicrobium sp.]|nr:methyltransferase [Rhizomicrobium sp.]
MSETTEDGFLGGRLRVRQFARGFRSGLDTVILAAAVPARSDDTVLELGSGAGVASLCLAARVPDCTVAGVEIDADLVVLANNSAAANGISERVRFVQGDVLNLPRELRAEFDHVLCNPPFHNPEGEASPNVRRALALQDSGKLQEWIRTAMKRTASNGTFTVIVRADRLTQVLDALPDDGVIVFPLWPKRDLPAKRVLIQLRCGSGARFALLPGLVLHESDGRYTREADAILRGEAALEIGESRR